ncbi:S1 family peptidase [Tepidimonas charontis]|uniref:Trypsin-like peptidase domain protein n=1 Tax=Tepidimonas charontis TaxID=2267262 RepID=A0A554XHZ9_9BURK|nr:serine protease [Tepidimonas charontis]TSE35409.1 Trypsin-like peptidase domain protein [Tepidimonas charontis]
MTAWTIDTAHKRLLYHTLRVDTVLRDGTRGTGTAFVLAHTYARGRALFVVTNHHLVEDVASGALVFTMARAGQPLLRSRFELRIEDFADAWLPHPDASVDLAITPLQPMLDAAADQGVELYWQPIDSHEALTSHDAAALDALEDVLFVGYPSGVWDQVNGLPILRRGITATPPGLDFEGRREFLIDAAVYPGSSGSPVFIVGSTPVGAETLRFAGVVTAVFFREETRGLVPQPVPASHSPGGTNAEMIDLGLVVKAEEVCALADAYLSRWVA